jgi:predicted dehydrogenase
LSFSRRPLRIGILGAGNIARDHARAIHALGHIIPVGCCGSPDSIRWHEFLQVAPEARFEPSGEALLMNPEIDAIVACLPWNVTEAWLRRLLTTSKPVLIEKPISLSGGILEAALQQAEGTLDNKIVGFNRRFYRPVQKIKERLVYGGLKAVEINISETLERFVNRFGPEIIPHTLAYSSCHMLDAALYLLGSLEPVRIYGYTEKGYPGPFYSLNGLLETSEGIPVALCIHADAPIPVGMRFYFDDRTVWHLSPMERLVAFRGYKVMEPTSEVPIRRYLPRPFMEDVVETAIKPGLLEQMRAFTTGEKREIAAIPAESLTLLSLIETLQAAAAATAPDAMIYH